MNDPALILGVVHNEGTGSLTGSDGHRCQGPGCSATFTAGGPKVRPRRFCSLRCRERSSIVNRAAGILGVTVDALMDLRGGYDEEA
jgi:hypothetical protein